MAICQHGRSMTQKYFGQWLTCTNAKTVTHTESISSPYPESWTKANALTLCKTDKPRDRRKYAYAFAIHNPRAMDGKEQPHCHLMFSERLLDGIERDPDQFFKRFNSKDPSKGGAKKTIQVSWIALEKR